VVQILDPIAQDKGFPDEWGGPSKNPLNTYKVYIASTKKNLWIFNPKS